MLSRAVKAAGIAARTTQKAAVVTQLQKANMSVFKYPPLPEDGIYRKPVLAPPKSPLHMEADAYWFDGVAPEPVADVDAHLNMRSALLQLTGLVTALSAIFWVPEYFMDPEDTFKLMPREPKTMYYQVQPQPQAREYIVSL